MCAYGVPWRENIARLWWIQTFVGHGITGGHHMVAVISLACHSRLAAQPSAMCQPRLHKGFVRYASDTACMAAIWIYQPL